MKQVQRLLLGFCIALAGALIANLVHMPLPWLLGPLLLVAATRIRGVQSTCTRQLRNAGQWVIGTSLGLYFTPFVAANLVDHAGLILLGIAYALLLGFLGTWVLQRFAGLDFPSAWFGAAIGGASEMANMAERYRARTDLVVTVHSLRVLMVVVIVPFSFQWLGVMAIDPIAPGARAVHADGLLWLVLGSCALGWICARLRVPNPWVLGPMAFALAVTVQGIELKGPNEEGAAAVGPFVANPAGTLTNRIAVDIVLPTGLFYASDNGGLDSRTVSWTIQAQKIDDQGNPMGLPITLGTETHSISR